MAPPVSGCLVLMCGFPSSGKSQAAADIARKIEAEGGTATIIDEPGLHLHRNAAYANGHAEKNTRGLLKSTVDRALYKDGPVVILDSGRVVDVTRCPSIWWQFGSFAFCCFTLHSVVAPTFKCLSEAHTHARTRGIHTSGSDVGVMCAEA